MTSHREGGATTAPDTPVCGCTPGSYENGWQEHRSETCEAQEREAWRSAVYLTWARQLRRDEEDE